MRISAPVCRVLVVPALTFLALASTFSAAQNTALPTASATAPTTAPWSYQGRTGPLVWYKLDRAYEICGKSHEQSPVDIRNARLNTALKPIQFHYIAAPVTVENNGHTIEVRVNPGSYIEVDGVRYNLVQFHFHHPSEHTIKGHLADMEAHLVHQSADGKLAVVAVLLNGDRNFPNATMATVWEHMPERTGQTEKIADMVNPGGLLPADRGYWTYTGSLTAPPCTEGVRWFVMEQQVSISREQLNTFASLFKMNTRPTQDLHGRKIEASE
jgi:carbonic anhydrase